MRGIKLCLLFAFNVNFLYQVYSATSRGLEIIPERTNVDYVNPEYVTNYSLNVRRTTKSAYGVNVYGDIYHTWGNNVTIDVILYEYLNNQYKRSFVEFHFKLCDMLSKDEFIGSIIGKYIKACPIPKGHVEIMNGTMKFSYFPYVFPFNKFKSEIILTAEPSHDVMARASLYVKVKQ